MPIEGVFRPGWMGIYFVLSEGRWGVRVAMQKASVGKAGGLLRLFGGPPACGDCCKSLVGRLQTE